MSRVAKVETWNSGGGCMITTMHVNDAGDVKRIDITDDTVIAFHTSLDERFANDDYDYEKDQLWSALCWHELRRALRNDRDLYLEILKHVYLYVDKYGGDRDFLRGCRDIWVL